MPVYRSVRLLRTRQPETSIGTGGRANHQPYTPGDAGTGHGEARTSARVKWAASTKASTTSAGTVETAVGGGSSLDSREVPTANRSRAALISAAPSFHRAPLSPADRGKVERSHDRTSLAVTPSWRASSSGSIATSMPVGEQACPVRPTAVTRAHGRPQSWACESCCHGRVLTRSPARAPVRSCLTAGWCPCRFPSRDPRTVPG